MQSQRKEKHVLDQQSLKLDHRYYASVYSQHGEDGYIAEIFRRIGTTNRRFVEIGVEQGLECNTRFLLECGWTGVWIDGNSELLTRAKNTFGDFVASGSLKIVDCFLTLDNVNNVVKSAIGDCSVDFLSIDTDQHTHHIWSALHLPSRVACLEYNSTLPMNVAIEVPYMADAAWDGTNYFGASLKSLEQKGLLKNMSLVGCESMGVNAFFVDSRLVQDKFSYPYTAENHFVPPGYGNYKDHRCVGWPPGPAKKWIAS